VSIYHVYRCLEGERAGNVDFLGPIKANGFDDAERIAKRCFDLSANEHFDIQQQCNVCQGDGFRQEDGCEFQCGACLGSGEVCT